MSKYCTAARGFNADTQSCCQRHDDDYAIGSGVSRMQADTALLICVSAHGMPYRGMLMFVILRLCGWVKYNDRLGRFIRFIGRSK